MKKMILGILMFAAPVLAQPNENAPMAAPEPRPVRAPEKPRPVEPEKQIAEDIQGFFNELNREYYAFGTRYVFGSRSGYYGGGEWFRELRPTKGSEKLELSDLQITKIEGDEAQVTVFYRFVPREGPRPKDGEDFKENLTLRRQHKPNNWVDGVWGIVLSDPKAIRPEKGFYLLDMSAYFMSQPPGVGPVLRSLQALNRLKMLGVGVLQLTQDYDDEFAFAPEYAREALIPYLKDETVLEVPGTHEKWAFNARLSGKNINQIAEPAKVVLFYDGADEKPVFRYNGKAAICFADGHVQMMTPEEVKKVIWQP